MKRNIRAILGFLFAALLLAGSQFSAWAQSGGYTDSNTTALSGVMTTATTVFGAVATLLISVVAFFVIKSYVAKGRASSR